MSTERTELPVVLQGDYPDWGGLNGEFNLDLEVSMPEISGVAVRGAKEFVQRKRTELFLGGTLFSVWALSACAAVQKTTDVIGGSGDWAGQLIDHLAKDPVSVIIPAAVTGAVYGASQVGWWAVTKAMSQMKSEEKEVPLAKTDTFKQMLIMARGLNLISQDDPDEETALSDFLTQIGVGKKPEGRKMDFGSELMARLKIIPLAEFEEWGEAAIMAYAAIALAENLMRMSDGDFSAGKLLVLLGAGSLALKRAYQAVKPFKQQ